MRLGGFDTNQKGRSDTKMKKKKKTLSIKREGPIKGETKVVGKKTRWIWGGGERHKGRDQKKTIWEKGKQRKADEVRCSKGQSQKVFLMKKKRGWRSSEFSCLGDPRKGKAIVNIPREEK